MPGPMKMRRDEAIETKPFANRGLLIDKPYEDAP